MKQLILAAVGLVSCLRWIPLQLAEAGGCYSQLSQQVVAVQAQPVYSYALYFVGAPVRQEALAQKAITSDPEYQEFLEFKEWKASRGLQTPPDIHDERLPLAAPTVVSTMCIKCHSGEEPKGDLRLDVSLTDDVKLKAMRMVWAGKMPPTAPLNNEQAAQMFEELLSQVPEERNEERLPLEAPAPPVEAELPPPVEPQPRKDGDP